MIHKLKEILKEHPFLKYALIVNGGFLAISVGYILGRITFNLY